MPPAPIHLRVPFNWLGSNNSTATGMLLSSEWCDLTHRELPRYQLSVLTVYWPDNWPQNISDVTADIVVESHNHDNQIASHVSEVS